ncbi:response regulator [Ensifer sp. NPDC090286]|uniref:response regulator n=1 Tax=Ensifer sp. NPDC090286 TaxID=3363991 RepID=UPI00383AFF26
MMPNLRHLRVLVAEDEFYVANDIALWLERAGATIIGPTPTVQETLKSLARTEDVQVAVLDINLNGELIFPVADELARRSVPLIFFSGYDDLSIPSRFHSATRLSKCVRSSGLVSAVFEQHLLSLSGLAPLTAAIPDQVVTDLLPDLRYRARLLMAGAPLEAADRLVERTLERAIAVSATRCRSQSLDAWLYALMAAIHGESPYGPN